MSEKIIIVGAGKMGSAMLSALPNATAVDKETDLAEVLPDADIIIFAVKPQDFTELKLDLPDKLIISIMAGISIEKIKAITSSKKIVRSMPNLPLQVKAGLTAWLATPEVEDTKPIKKIFSSFGEEIEVQNESDLDKITALSGSGPAYFFYLCELIQEKAEALGFTPEQAKKIASQTFIGSAQLLNSSEKSAAEFRTAVTSKGGTTEAALAELKPLQQILNTAIDAAENRAKELNS